MNWQNRIYENLTEAESEFDKATLDAEDRARRTGEKPKLPKWEGPTSKEIKASEVIDTSTPEGKARVVALQKAGVKSRPLSMGRKKKASKTKKSSGHPGQGRLFVGASTEMNWQNKIYESLTETRASDKTAASAENWNRRRAGESVEAFMARTAKTPGERKAWKTGGTSSPVKKINPLDTAEQGSMGDTTAREASRTHGRK